MPPSSLIPASSKRHETKVCVQFEQCEKNNRGNFLIFRCASPAWIHISSTVEEEKGFSAHVQIKSGKSTQKSSLDEAYSRRRCPENARKIEHNESVFPSTRNKRIFVHFLTISLYFFFFSFIPKLHFALGEPLTVLGEKLYELRFGSRFVGPWAKLSWN